MTAPANNDAALVRDARGSSMNDLEQRKDETTDQYIDRLRSAAERADEAALRADRADDIAAEYLNRAGTAEAALLAAQQERDEAVKRLAYYKEPPNVAAVVEAQRDKREAEATVTRLRGALARIAADNDEVLHQFGDARQIARAALAQDAEQENV